MASWLVKTEPSTYSYDDLAREGRTRWDGVSNNLALIHLRAFSRGDRILIYHTGSEKAIVGMAEAASDPYPDPAAGDPRLVAVDLVPRERLRAPVSLEAMKARKELAALPLLRNSRLSVMPVSAAEWKTLLSLAR
jgi:predicted RNA-binding protein with PUA-like domain